MALDWIHSIYALFVLFIQSIIHTHYGIRLDSLHICFICSVYTKHNPFGEISYIWYKLDTIVLIA